MNALKSRLPAGALTLVLAGSAVLPAYAADAADEPRQGSKPTNIGAVTGFAVGAVAGGPLGAALGAGVGALIGDHYHKQALAKVALVEDLKTSEAERARLTASVAQLDSSLSLVQTRSDQLDQTLRHTDDLSVDVSFRTNDDSVTTQAISPLLKLGALVASLPQAQLHIAGYADPRGSDALNDALSLRRAQNVAAVLASAGVPAERISIEAYGKSESTSEEGDLDAYALERRVTVRMQLPGSGQVASRD